MDIGIYEAEAMGNGLYRGVRGIGASYICDKRNRKNKGDFRRRGKRELMGIDNLGEACDVKCYALKGSNTKGLQR